MDVNIYSLENLNKQKEQFDPRILLNQGLLNHRAHIKNDQNKAYNAFLETDFSTQRFATQKEITVNISKKA